jgi:hypothetical protein
VAVSFGHFLPAGIRAGFADAFVITSVALAVSAVMVLMLPPLRDKPQRGFRHRLLPFG